MDIYHAHGGEAFEGEGVVTHRFHGMTLDIPMFLPKSSVRRSQGRAGWPRWWSPEATHANTEQ